MLTLSICYTFDPNRSADFKAYVDAEMEPIRRSGGTAIQYFLPTEFAGPTNQALGLIDFPSLADYERYRAALAADADHKKNVERLEKSGAVLSMTRSIIKRVG
ncbi:MAG TPA: NIPSNAP family protein [Bryobacteraceae bacterium]|nr:NIPSNAP family protein [Bryobacteraceae bacterium]